jgi:hypothetical protein
MHPASYAEWIALIERYRRAVKAYSEAVRLLAGLKGAPENELASQRVEQAHLVCEHLRAALRAYQENDCVKTDDSSTP